jgi:hypothetical protein
MLCNQLYENIKTLVHDKLKRKPHILDINYNTMLKNIDEYFDERKKIHVKLIQD